MHMPYPVYVPTVSQQLNDYLWQEIAPKSLQLCGFFGCNYIVVHGFMLARYLGSEEAEWEQTQKLLDDLAPMAKELGITMCVENLYDGISDLHQIPFTFTKTRENKTSTDWEGFIRGLRSIQFDGVLSFETAPVLDSFPEEMKPEVSWVYQSYWAIFCRADRDGFLLVGKIA